MARVAPQSQNRRMAQPISSRRRITCGPPCCGANRTMNSSASPPRGVLPSRLPLAPEGAVSRLTREGRGGRVQGLRARRPEGRAGAHHARCGARCLRLHRGGGGDPLARSARQVSGYSRFHFLRLFRLHTGLTPRSYAESVRARRSHAAFATGERVADAVAGASFGSESRVYEHIDTLLGMTLGAARRAERARPSAPLSPIALPVVCSWERRSAASASSASPSPTWRWRAIRAGGFHAPR
jgi:AraC-like DNA-binding protein